MSGTRQYTGTWITFVALAIVGIIVAIILLQAEEEAATPPAIESPAEQIEEADPPASSLGEELAP